MRTNYPWKVTFIQVGKFCENQSILGGLLIIISPSRFDSMAPNEFFPSRQWGIYEFAISKHDKSCVIVIQATLASFLSGTVLAVVVLVL